MRCVESIFDTDLYKFTTSYAYMKMYPNAIGTFKFTDRNNTSYTYEQYQFICNQLYQLQELRHVGNIPDNWLKNNIPFIPMWYWEWLVKSFQFELDKIGIYYDIETGHLDIEVTDYLYKVTLYEIPILCIISEAQHLGNEAIADELYMPKLYKKLETAQANNIYFSEFGTRRRYSRVVQENVVAALKNCPNCLGTSNVELAMTFGMKPIGTHPHEWFMFHGAQFGYKHANYLALQAWTDVYHGDLGIALSDTYTTDLFFENFSMQHAKLFDGIRQDSGDEFEFVDKAVAHYKKHKIVPLTKTIVFSNGLNFDKCVKINEYCKDKIKATYGIGTNLTNDCGVKAPNIVMKLISCQMTPTSPVYPCIKISDDEGKHMGDPNEINICLDIIKTIKSN